MAVDPELGYDPAVDQFHYSRGLVAELLPMALAGPEPPAAGPVEGGGSGDPAVGGNMLVMILDVRRVMPADDWTYKQALHSVVHGIDFPTDLLDTIVDRLGGPA